MKALAAGLLATVLLTGCGGTDHPAAADRRPIRVVLLPFLGYAPLIIAQAEGFFAEAGLTVEFININRSPEALPALLRGDVDVLPGTAASSVITAMAKGQPLRFVADKGYLSPDGCSSMGIVVRADFPVDQAASRLRRISISRDGPTRYVASHTLASHGIELDSLESVLLPDAAEAEAMRKGAIDATMGGEPWLSRMRHEVAVKIWLDAQDYLPDHQYSFLLYGKYLLETNRDAGIRFLVAFRRGVAQFNQGKTERNLALLTRELGEDRAILEEACWPAMRLDGRIRLESLLQYQRWARAHGFLDVEATPAQLWDSTFLVASDPLMVNPTGGR